MPETRHDVTPEMRRLGRTALEAVEGLLEEQDPDTAYESISKSARCLTRLRDHLIEQRRAGAAVPRERLDGINAIISVASSAEYPLVGVRWERMRLVRDSLRDFLAEEGTGTSAAEGESGTSA